MIEFLLMKASWSNNLEIRKEQVAKGYKELKSDVWTVRMGKLLQWEHEAITALPVLFVSLDSLCDLLALIETIDTTVIIEKTKVDKPERLQSGKWTLLVYDDYLKSP